MVVTLNRPEARNALTPSMIQDLSSALAAADSDPGVRCVVITGSGAAFCAGADVKDFQQVLKNSGRQGLSDQIGSLATLLHNDVILAIRRLPKPVIASVNGVAAGAGFSLALACDLRIAAEDARLVMAYAGIGATADGGSTYLLPRLIGQARTMELYLDNPVLDARRALELGLVSRIVPTGELAQQCMQWAQRLAQGPTVAYARMKELMDLSWSSSFASQLDSEARAIADVALTEDFSEGISAFVDKRKPKFQGR